MISIQGDIVGLADFYRHPKVFTWDFTLKLKEIQAYLSNWIINLTHCIKHEWQNQHKSSQNIDWVVPIVGNTSHAANCDPQQTDQM